MRSLKNLLGCNSRIDIALKRTRMLNLFKGGWKEICESYYEYLAPASNEFELISICITGYCHYNEYLTKSTDGFWVRHETTRQLTFRSKPAANRAIIKVFYMSLSRLRHAFLPYWGVVSMP